MGLQEVIKVPSSLNLTNTIEFISSFENIKEGKEYIIDFSDMRWIEPFPMLCLANEIRCLLKNFRGKSRFKVKGFRSGEASSYASYMRFYRTFGLSFEGDNTADKSVDSPNYIPIQVLNVESLKRRAAEKVIVVEKYLDEYSLKMAQKLIRKNDGELIKTLEYSIREILRNIIDHSQAKKLAYCGQYWPSRRQVEIAIIDTGVGIYETIRNNPYLRMNCDKDAIKYSLLPGISGKMFKGMPSNPHDIYENSGFGLYMASQICRNGGSFSIFSKSAGIKLTQDNMEEYSSIISGTAIRMKIDISRIGSLSDSLKEYKKNALEKAKNLNGAILDPSKASMMVFK